MSYRVRVWTQWAGYFLLVMSPSLLVVLWLVFGVRLNRGLQSVLIVVALAGFVGAQGTVEKLRSVAEDDKIRSWLAAARRRDKTTAGAMIDDDPLPAEMGKQAHWRRIDGEKLERALARVLRRLGRRVQRAGDLRHKGIDLVVDGSTIVQFTADGKRATSLEVQGLYAVRRSYPVCRTAILVSPKGFARGARKQADDTSMILLDAGNIARLVRDEELV